MIDFEKLRAAVERINAAPVHKISGLMMDVDHLLALADAARLVLSAQAEDDEISAAYEGFYSKGPEDMGLALIAAKLHREGSPACLSGLASNEPCKPEADNLKRCTICGFVVDTKYAAEFAKEPHDNRP